MNEIVPGKRKFLVALPTLMLAPSIALAADFVSINLEDGTTITVTEAQLNAWVAAGVAAAVEGTLSIGSRIIKGFSTQAVLRDTLGRAALTTLVSNFVLAHKGQKLTLETIFSLLGLDVGVATGTTVMQEVLQLFLRYKYSMSEQPAKWMAFAVAQTVLGTWVVYVRRKLSAAFERAFRPKIIHDETRRKLLAADYASSFTNAWNQSIHPTAIDATRLSVNGRYPSATYGPGLKEFKNFVLYLYAYNDQSANFAWTIDGVDQPIKIVYASALVTYSP